MVQSGDKLYGDNGSIYVLSKELAHGGEGYVFELQYQAEKVAKIFIQQDRKRNEKLQALRSLPWPEDVRRSVVLPEVILYQDDKGRIPVGYIMEKVDCSCMLAGVYGEKHPLSMMKRAYIAIDLCRVVKCLHATGKVCVGDFNSKNIVVNQATGKTRIIDIDSLHINVKRNGVPTSFPCKALDPILYMPEIIDLFNSKKGKDLEAIFENGYQTFSKYTDYYCLAYHIHLLLLQCQPFGRALNPELVNDSVPLPNGRSMACKGYYSYFKLPEGTRLPDSFPDFNVITPKLQKLFIRAFVDGATDPTKRPSADEFYSALDEYIDGLKYCKCNNWNHYLHKNFKGGSCEWCRIEKVKNVKIKVDLNDIQYATNMELNRLVEMPVATNDMKAYALIELGLRYTGIAHVIKSGDIKIEKNKRKAESYYKQAIEIADSSSAKSAARSMLSKLHDL